VKDQLREQPKYVAKELEVGHTYEELRTKLQELQIAGNIPDIQKIPTGHSSKNGASYKALAHKYGLQAFNRL
jgi:hypothetical protein